MFKIQNINTIFLLFFKGDLEIKINLVADGSEQIEFFYLR